MNKKEFEEIKKKFEDENRKKRIRKITNWILTIISIIGIAIISYYYVDSIFLNKNDNTIDSNLVTRFENLKEENQQLELEIEKLKSNKNKDTSYQTSSLIARERINELEEKYNSLNNMISDNPEKSLTIPLLKKEIENQKSNNAVRIQALNDRIETVLDLNKWILGLIFSLLITIVLSNIFTFFLKRESKSNTEISET